jgi:hypothetical protein
MSRIIMIHRTNDGILVNMILSIIDKKAVHIPRDGSLRIEPLDCECFRDEQEYVLRWFTDDPRRVNFILACINSRDSRLHVRCQHVEGFSAQNADDSWERTLPDDIPAADLLLRFTRRGLP